MVAKNANKTSNKTSKISDEMTFLAHLEELRKLLIRSVVVFFLFSGVAYYFYEEIIAFLMEPYMGLNSKINPEAGKLYVNGVLEGFMVRLKVTFLAGLIFSFPVHVYHAMRFVVPALHRYEKRVIAALLLLSFVLVGVSVFYSYSTIIPISIQFLTNAGFIPENVGILLGFNNNVFFIFQFMLIALVIFQMPIVMQLLMLFNVIKRTTLIKHARGIMLGIFFFSAILTPPDPVSLLAIALPMVVIFFSMLGIAAIFRLGQG